MPEILPSVRRPNNPKLLDQVRAVSRLKHYSIRTEQAYADWIRRFIVFHSRRNNGAWRHPREMAEAEVSEFLTYLADDKNVAASTQNQALNALLFLYKEVLKQQIGWIDQVDRVRKPKKMPVVLSRDEVKRIFAHLNGVSKLMAGLRSDNRPRCKRRQRPRHDPASKPRRAFATSFAQSEDSARARH